MKYKSGYKHQLTEDSIIQLPESFRFNKPIVTPFITLVNGKLVLSRGFAWDGASGPTWDTKNVMKPSCVHDALAKLMRMGLIEHKFYTKADKLLYAMLKEAGMAGFRLWYWKRGLNGVKGKYAKKSQRKKIHTC